MRKRGLDADGNVANSLAGTRASVRRDSLP